MSIIIISKLINNHLVQLNYIKSWSLFWWLISLKIFVLAESIGLDPNSLLTTSCLANSPHDPMSLLSIFFLFFFMVDSQGLAPSVLILPHIFKDTWFTVRQRDKNPCFNWHRLKESNFRLRVWNPSCYLYTKSIYGLEERKGFEPSAGLTLHPFSRREP